MKDITPQEVGALLALLLSGALLFLGVDGEVKGIFALAAGWCFGAGITKRIKKS